MAVDNLQAQTAVIGSMLIDESCVGRVLAAVDPRDFTSEPHRFAWQAARQLAREGKTVQRKTRPITIYNAALTAFDGESFSFTAVCSAGTYIRTLAEDVAAKCGALCHLTALRRTEGCGFTLAQAVTLAQLQKAAEAGTAEQFLVSPEAPFLHLDAVSLNDNLWRLFINGFAFAASRCCKAQAGTQLRIYREGRFAALARVNEKGELIKLWQAEAE